ncbi:MAG TPA: hypothetical protein DHV36_12920, partial [Desulfobacteraceae bacterium]|nr:hypothetical protein [Desulfobacteraceae bacterium]
MKLSVPFIPDPGYADFLAQHVSALASIYFPLDTETVMDARVRSAISSHADTGETDRLNALLKSLRPVDKYVLANTRFVHPDLYSNPVKTGAFLNRIAQMDDATGIKGIVVADAYLVNALDQTAHHIIPKLSIIPGVNSMIDSREKFLAWMDLIHGTRFKLPDRLIPDRSLNRDLNRLETLAREVRRTLPG